MVGGVLVVGFFSLIVTFLVWQIITGIKENRQFKPDETNPFRRVCKDCGARQEVMSTNYSELPNVSWWEQVAPGTNPDCECRKYDDSHEKEW